MQERSIIEFEQKIRKLRKRAGALNSDGIVPSGVWKLAALSVSDDVVFKADVLQ